MSTLSDEKKIQIPNIDVRGKTVAEAMVFMQMVIVRQAIQIAGLEIDKLEKYLKELKSYENKKHYYCDFGTFDRLR